MRGAISGLNEHRQNSEIKSSPTFLNAYSNKLPGRVGDRGRCHLKMFNATRMTKNQCSSDQSAVIVVHIQFR